MKFFYDADDAPWGTVVIADTFQDYADGSDALDWAEGLVLSDDQARELRDFLLQHYPLTAAKDAGVAPVKKRPHGAQEYKGFEKQEWEFSQASDVERLRVPGGWLYRDGALVVFVPMPDAVGYAV